MKGMLRETVTSPGAWIAGAAGFLARGGVLILALPILSLPTPVGVTLLIPPVSVTTSGISSSLVPELVAVAAVALLAVVAALVLGAVADALAYERTIGRASPPEGDSSALTGGRASLAHTGIAGLVGRLVGVEIVALVPTLAAAIVAADRLIAVGRQEYLLPSSTAIPYVVRVVQGAWPEVVALGICLVVTDLLNALLSRVVLWRAVPRTTGIGRRRLPVPLRIAATWAAAWLVTGASLLPGLALIGITWPWARDAYTATMSQVPPAPVALLSATVVLVAAWLAAAFLTGLGSAIRTFLWTFCTMP